MNRPPQGPIAAHTAHFSEIKPSSESSPFDEAADIGQVLASIDADSRLTDEERNQLRTWTVEEAMSQGIVAACTQWQDVTNHQFSRAERETITIWISGLTFSQDLFVSAALRSLGYHVRPLPVPDNEALRLGKEFGNRGQCNPTYFTVGNLLKHLQTLSAEGHSNEEIVRNHVFLTAGACGPCRFGTYVTEYRKALRDSGYEGFRVVLFQQQGGLSQATGDDMGFEINPSFFRALIKGFLAGDVLNLMGYRIRPYEVQPGATDRVIEQSRAIIIDALESNKNMLRALWRCRSLFRKIEVNRLQAKPIVSIIGEFWAMTTEGDGNYRLQQFLEKEGAEVAIQPITNWILFIIWEQMTDTKWRQSLRGVDGGRRGLRGKEPWKKLLLLRFAKFAFKAAFRSYAFAIGLKGYELPDMEQIAELAHHHYDNAIRGGEGHMEVGKVIDCAQRAHAHMVISVKPFGCMPSSSVSDGVQSYVQGAYPDLIFLPIETSGDGQVNVESRIQMMLFKAHKKAQAEFADALSEKGLDPSCAEQVFSRSQKAQNPLYFPSWEHGCLATRIAYSIA